MYQVSDEYNTELQKYSRTFRARITVGTNTISEEIKNITISLGSCGADTFTIGSVFTSYISVVTDYLNIFLANNEMFLEIGLAVGDEIIYIPMGYFTATLSDISRVRDKVTITAYDRISTECNGYYVPSVTFPCTVQSVIDDIASQAGVTISTNLVTSGTIEAEMSGLLYKEALGYIAGILGGFCYADRNGVICLAAYPAASSVEVEAERQTQALSTSETAYTVSALTIVVSESGTDADGEEVDGKSYTYGTGTGVSVANPYMTETLFDAMKSSVVGYTFNSGTAIFLGDPRLDPSDAILAYNYAGESFLIPCMNLIQYYDGGLTTTVTAPAEATEEATAGPLTQSVERLETEMILAQNVIAKKVSADELKAKVADFGFVTADQIDAQVATFIKLSTSEIYAAIADFEYITADKLDASVANILKLTTSELYATLADIGYLTADSATITDLTADLANITTILSGSIGTGTLQAIHITGDNVVFDEAVIASAAIVEVSADKITSGTIYTDLVQIANNDGQNLWIDGATIQISDGTYVRVQIGEDASGDYNMYLWNADGVLIWDALGLTEAGLTGNGAIIKDAAVADDAAIKGTKLDIDSVIESIEDNGSLTVDYSKVTIDNTTLSAWYTTVNTAVDDLGSTTSELQTGLSVVQDNIDLIVSQTDIEELTSGDTTLFDIVSSISENVDSITSSVFSMETFFGEHYSTTETLSSVISQEVADRSASILLEVSDTYVTNAYAQENYVTTGSLALVIVDDSEATYSDNLITDPMAWENGDSDYDISYLSIMESVTVDGTEYVLSGNMEESNKICLSAGVSIAGVAYTQTIYIQNDDTSDITVTNGFGDSQTIAAGESATVTFNFTGDGETEAQFIIYSSVLAMWMSTTSSSTLSGYRFAFTYSNPNIYYQVTVPAAHSELSADVDYIYLTSGELVIESNGFTLDRDGNATFSGELQAATGTFSGELSAATGTFAGSLTACDIRASKINIEGGSMSGVYTMITNQYWSSGGLFTSGQGESSSSLYQSLYIRINNYSTNTNATLLLSSGGTITALASGGLYVISETGVYGSIYAKTISNPSGTLNINCATALSGIMTFDSGYILIKSKNNGIACGNNGGVYHYLSSGDSFKKCEYMNSSDQFCVGNNSYVTILYGSSVYLKGTSTAVTSDRRLKYDFAEMTDAHDAFFDALVPQTYRMIASPEKVHMGFVVQEVEQALSDADLPVDEYGLTSWFEDEDDGVEYGAIAQDELIALLVYEVQNLKTQVKELQASA